jgi:hypothetical protein
MKNRVSFEFNVPEGFASEGHVDVKQHSYDLFFNDGINSRNARLIELVGKTDAHSIAETKIIEAELQAIKSAKESATMTVTDIKEQPHPFPDFTLDVVLPEGFIDISWGNDISPSFQNTDLELILYIDYAEAEKREYPTSERFTLVRTEDGQHTGNDEDHLLTTNEYDKIIERIETVRSELSKGPKL